VTIRDASKMEDIGFSRKNVLSGFGKVQG